MTHYTVRHRGKYNGHEYYTCHWCGEIRSTTQGPCSHWRLDRDGWPRSWWPVSATIVWYGAWMVLGAGVWTVIVMVFL